MQNAKCKMQMQMANVIGSALNPSLQLPCYNNLFTLLYNQYNIFTIMGIDRGQPDVIRPGRSPDFDKSITVTVGTLPLTR